MSQEEEKITFSIIGSSIDEGAGLPFDKFGTIVSSYQKIITNTYLACIGKSRNTPAVRANLTLKNLRKGSIEWDVFIYALSTYQAAVSSGQNPFLTISAMVDAVFQFIKAKRTHFNEHGKNPEIPVINSPGAIVQIGGGSIVISGNVLRAADKTEASFADLSGVVDGGDVSEVRSFGPNQEGFSITAFDREVFHPSTKITPNVDVEIDSDIVEMEAKIFRFDVSSMRGNMKITNRRSASDMDNGENVPFLLINKEKGDLCVGALRSSVSSSRLKVKRKFVTHASGTRTIRSLHILDIVNDVRST